MKRQIEVSYSIPQSDLFGAETVRVCVAELMLKMARAQAEVGSLAADLTDWDHPKRLGWHLEVVHRHSMIDIEVMPNQDRVGNDITIVANSEPDTWAHTWYSLDDRMPI